MVIWRDEFATGIAAIDEQHKRLFEIANEAYALLKNELRVDKYDDIVAILGELRDYAVYHFKSEEEYMMSIGYRKFLSHKAEHADFIAKIDAVDFDNIDDDQDKYLQGTLDFICNWIADHILVRDKQYVGA